MKITNYSQNLHWGLECFWEPYLALFHHRWIHFQGCILYDFSLSWLYASHSGHLAHHRPAFERFWSRPCLKNVCIDQVSCRQSLYQWCLDSLVRIVKPIDLEKPIFYPFSQPFLLVLLFTDQTLDYNDHYLCPCLNLQFRNRIVVNQPCSIEPPAVFDFFGSHSVSTIFKAFLN